MLQTFQSIIEAIVCVTIQGHKNKMPKLAHWQTAVQVLFNYWMNLKQLSEIHDYKFPKINVFLQIVLTLRAYTRGRTTPLPERNIIEPTLEPFEVPSWTLLHCQQNLLKNIFRSKPHLAHSLCARATTSFETWSDFTDQLLAF